MKHKHHRYHSGAGYARCSHRREHCRKEYDHLLYQVELDPREIGNEQGRQCLVQGGAIHVQSGAQRHDETCDIALDMQMLFDAAQGDRQGSGAGTGGECRDQSFPRAPPELERTHAGDQIQDQRQNDHAMQQRSHDHHDDEFDQHPKQSLVLRGSQLQQQRHDAQRGQPHDPAHQHQHQLEQFLQ